MLKRRVFYQTNTRLLTYELRRSPSDSFTAFKFFCCLSDLFTAPQILLFMIQFLRLINRFTGKVHPKFFKN